MYLSRLNDGWVAKVKEESSCRVAGAYAAHYDPQSSEKKLGPWASKTQMDNLDDFLEELDDQRIEALARDMLGEDDEIGYFDEDDDDDFDDGWTNCADGAVGSEAFDSCWDRNS